MIFGKRVFKPAFCSSRSSVFDRQFNQTHLTMNTILAFAAIVAVATAAPAGPPAPYHPAPAHHAPAHYDETPKPYAYEYGVQDDYSGANFAQHETSDSKVVTGSYSVHLPDGRVQHVTYQADPYGYGGYIADVKYDGHATYPKYEPKPYHPAPAYKPAPHPAPAYKPVHPAPAYKPAPHHG